MTKISKFDSSAIDHLKHYVYRLMDPRSGHTFYVGKGQKNRVFDHLAGDIERDGDELLPLKLEMIAAIRKAGLEPHVIIHRHGMDNQTALVVEAALIDAFPELSNLVSGQHSTDFGCRSANEIADLYSAPIADLTDVRAVLINIRSSLLKGRSVYDGARYHWVLKSYKANSSGIVVAHDSGFIRGIFQECHWFRDTDDRFKKFWSEGRVPKGRFGFVGKEASDPKLKGLLRQRLDPSIYQRRGAANPIRYSY